MGKVTVNKKEPGGIITCESGRKYIFLKQEGDQIMAVSEGLMAEDVIFDKNSPDYSKSSLRKLMDETILPLLEEDFDAGNILEHEADLTTVDMQKDYGTCRCKVRPMTFDEARVFNDLLVNKDLPDWWWTCTPWSTKERGWEYSVTVVSPSGDVNNDDYGNYNGVRPFCILKSNIFESLGRNVEERIKALEDAVKKMQKQQGVKIRKYLGTGDQFQLLGMNWKILEISDKGYHCLVMDHMEDLSFDSSGNEWKSSSLRSYLNGDFYKALLEEVGEENIIPFDRNLLSLDGQTEYGTCEDKVSLLTVDEYRKYRSMIPNTDDYWWWLVTPYSTKCNGESRFVAVVSPSGNINYGSCGYGNGVRPFCIFGSAIFESEDQ